MRFIWILMAILALSGCGSLSTPSILDSTERKTGSVPRLGAEATAAVGSVIYSQFKYLSRPVYRLDESRSMGFALGRIDVASGDTAVRATLDKELTYCTTKKVYIDPLVGPWNIACFYDNDADGKFERLRVAPGAIWFQDPLTPQLPYTETEQIIQDRDSFRYELLYQGISKNTIKVLYREFVDDFARPAFFQDASYDIDKTPTTLTFRTVRIEVLQADNTKIVHRVLSGF
jgi:hypothetical protein